MLGSNDAKSVQRLYDSHRASLTQSVKYHRKRIYTVIEQVSSFQTLASEAKEGVSASYILNTFIMGKKHIQHILFVMYC